MRTVNVFAASWLPALSMAKYVSVVSPSAAMATLAPAPASVREPVAAPASAMWISLTPEPPALFSAARLTVTERLFQPLEFGPGFGVAAVVGAIVSEDAADARKPRLMNGCGSIPRA